jgi:hypothetical protein
VALQDHPDARGGDADADSGELALYATVAPFRVLLGQPEDERGSSLRDRRSTGSTVRVGPALGDEVPVPAQKGCWLDEEASETLTGHELRKGGKDRPVGRLQRRSVDLPSEDRHLMAQHDNLDREVCVTTTDEPDQLEHATERPVEERESHFRMLVGETSWVKVPALSRWMAFSAPTGYGFIALTTRGRKSGVPPELSG